MKAKAKKLYAKLSLFFVMCAMFIAAVIPAVGGAVLMARNVNTSEIISVETIQTEGTVNTGIDIAKAKIGDDYSDAVSITITDKNGNEIVAGATLPNPNHFKGTVALSGDKYILTPSEAGTYTVVYSYENAGISVFTREYKIKVTGNTASFQTQENQYLKVVSGGSDWGIADNSVVYPIIPSQMNDSQDFVYYVPVLNILNADGEVITGANVSDVQIYSANSEYILGGDNEHKLTHTKTLTVKVNGEGEDRTTYAFKPLAGDHGVYTIVYSYNVDGGDTQFFKRTFDVVAQSVFNPTTDLSFTSTAFASTFPTTIVLDTEVTLPKLNIVQSNEKANETYTNEFYTDIKVYKNDGSGLETVSVDGYTFFADWDADYYFDYTVYDAFGNSKELGRKTILKENVSDTKGPTVKIVEDYNPETPNFEDSLEDATNLIPSTFYQKLVSDYIYYHNGTNFVNGSGVIVEEANKVKVNDKKCIAEIEFPAIYAEDNTTGFDDLTKTRQIVYGTKTYNLDTLSNTDRDLTNDKIIVDGLSTGKTEGVKQNESVKVYFTEAGSYTLSYFAKDAEGNKSQTLTFTVVIAASTDSDSEKPIISNEKALPSKILQGSTLNFAQPTATDDSDGTRIDCLTYYFYDAKTITAAMAVPQVSSDTDLKAYLDGDHVTFEGLTKLVDNGLLTPTVNEDGTISIDNTKGTTPETYYDKITIVSFAIDKYQQTYGAENNKTVGLLVSEIDVYASLKEANAPQITNITKPANYDFVAYTNENNQEDGFYFAGDAWTDDATFDGAFTNAYKDHAIHLPSFVLTDEDKGVVVRAQVYREVGESFVFDNEFAISSTKSTVAGTTTYTTKDASFIPTFGGEYKLVLLATDSYKNISCVAFDFTVEEWLEIDVVLDDEFPTIAELNETITLPSVKVIAANKANKGEDITNVAGTSVSLELLGGDGELYSPEDVYEFTGTEHNKEYSFRYTINATGMKEAKVIDGSDYKIKVADTTAPTIKLNVVAGTFANNGLSETEENQINLIELVGGGYADIEIPYFSAIDEDVKSLDKTITYGTNQVSIESSVSQDGTKLIFNPSRGSGKYTVTYKAVDENDLTSTKVYVLSVGDTDKPVITLGSSNSFGTQALNSTITLNTTSAGISIYDAKSDLEDFDLTEDGERLFDLVIKAPSGKEVQFSELSNNSFTFDESGEYTFTYTAKDSAGNIGTYVQKVTVSAAEEAQTEEDDGKDSIVWPIIIIVLSLAILGFVVWFFLAEHKKKGGKKNKTDKQPKEKKSKKVKKQKDDSDKIVV